ncbi:hypothetical protein ACPOL_0969 [Acidisarcina polymorpha]|uniref:Uncharacterized protein n=1 Tax=Acidisarcina polymorpha TaxID=2211140 RepID=A0A2Z5FU37_9BACT|nr:hypothetical protein ACPOL_0969 [Acidisarcina polymorpha]
MKVTDPVGVALDAAVTVATKVTGSPSFEGLLNDFTVVVVGIAFGTTLYTAVATALGVKPLPPISAIAFTVVIGLETVNGPL